MEIIAILTLLLLYISKCSCNNFYNDNNNSSIDKKFSTLAKSLENINIINDEKCRRDVNSIISGLSNLTHSAYEFYDASAKFPDGILSGSVYQLGNFDECINISHETGLRGKYCLINVTIDIPFTNQKQENSNSIWSEFKNAKNTKLNRYDNLIDKLFFGICVPASCNFDEVENYLQAMINHTYIDDDFSIRLFVDEKKCYEKQVINLDTYDTIYLAFVLVIILFVTIGTIFHAVTLNKENDIQGLLPNILRAFSVIHNLRKLCSDTHDDGLNLGCISGIKFITMGFIIAGHSLVFILGGPILNKNFWQEATGKIENSIFLNSPLLVDTFLFLSGFLFAKILLHELDKRKSINFLFLYLFRYIRLTPVYFVMIGLYVTLLPKLDSGPLWSRMIEEQNRCRVSWWANLLYINNYINTDQICMFQSWYLSVDTQLFILAPIVIYPLWRWRKAGELILSSVTALSVAIPFIMTLANNSDPTLMIYRSEIEDVSTNLYFKTSYIKTHMRATGYCFGLIFGYLLYRIQLSNYKFSKITVSVYWILATLSLIASMFSITIFYSYRKDFLIFEAAAYSAFHRVFWSLGTGWVIIACVTNNAGPIQNFLKWKPFVCLSRLTYCAYLFNGFVELYSISTVRSPRYLHVVDLFAIVMSHLVMTFLGALILSMIFEGPYLSLERAFLRPAMESSKLKKNQHNVTSTETQ